MGQLVSSKNPFETELTADMILHAYQAGIFPMSESADDPDIFWVSPEDRGILPLNEFHISKSLAKTLRQTQFKARFDSDFEQTIQLCATKGTDRKSTWINQTIRTLYGELFDGGHCHTVEIWDQDEMVGGLYGLAIGGAFFGESMFHTKPNASKIALFHLVERLNSAGFSLLDTQFLTPHLASLGGIEIPREHYEHMLAHALQRPANFSPLQPSRQYL